MGFTKLGCFTGEKGYLMGNDTDRLEAIVVDEIRYFVGKMPPLPKVVYRFIRECTSRYEEAIVTTVTNASRLKEIATQMLQRGYFDDEHDGNKPYVSEEDIEREYHTQ